MVYVLRSFLILIFYCNLSQTPIKSVFRNNARNVPIQKLISSKAESNGEMAILYATGKQVLKQDISLTEGLNNVKFNIADIPSGIYYTKISIGKIARKVIKFSKN